MSRSTFHGLQNSLWKSQEIRPIGEEIPEPAGIEHH